MSSVKNQNPSTSSLNQRVKSALVLMPVALLVLWSGGFAYLAVMVAVSAIAFREWADMVTAKAEARPQFLLQVSAGIMAIVMGGAALFLNPLHGLFLSLAGALLIFAYNWSENGTESKRLMFGLVYIGFSMSTLMWLREGTAQGLYNVLILLFLIWSSDSFAYFAGRAIGGPKLAPNVSPKKTWAGFFGSSIGAAVVVGGLSCPVVVGFLDVDPLASVTVMMVVAFVLAMFGQAGDLIVSAVKRHYGVKDTGNLIPGHGGILDRIDALLFVAPIFSCFVYVVMG